MKLHTPNLGAPACARSFARLRLASRAQLHAFRAAARTSRRLRLASRAQLHAFRAAARTSRRLHARTGAHTRLRAGCFAWLRACSASRGCASCRLHARTCTLSASHGFTRLGALRAARGRLRSLHAGCFAWLGAAWRVLNSRVYINWARFARLPTLRAGFVRAAERARLRAASHASRGFAPFARASRTRFARLHAPRAGFVRAPAHAHLRTRGFARLRGLRVASRAHFARAASHASRGLVASPGRIILHRDVPIRTQTTDTRPSASQVARARLRVHRGRCPGLPQGCVPPDTHPISHAVVHDIALGAALCSLVNVSRASSCRWISSAFARYRCISQNCSNFSPWCLLISSGSASSRQAAGLEPNAHWIGEKPFTDSVWLCAAAATWPQSLASSSVLSFGLWRFSRLCWVARV